MTLQLIVQHLHHLPIVLLLDLNTKCCADAIIRHLCVRAANNPSPDRRFAACTVLLVSSGAPFWPQVMLLFCHRNEVALIRITALHCARMRITVRMWCVRVNGSEAVEADSVSVQ